MIGYRLYKKEKLCSLTAIEALFSSQQNAVGGNNSIMAYPWRAIWRINNSEKRKYNCPQFLISVPKKKLRHAVDRVLMRRRCREAYRLNKHILSEVLPVDLAFIYVSNTITDYSITEKSIIKILTRISDYLEQKIDENG